MTGSLVAGAFVACDEDDTFEINSPSWLESRIDSIAASKNVSTGDTTIIEVASSTIGETDNSGAWWSAFSDFIAIPSGKRLVMEFDNYTSGASNWNNWVLVTANKKGNSTDVDGYKEYFALRSDAYGWTGAMGTEEGYTYEADNITTNYAEVAEAAGAETWAYFLENMNGAHVVMEIQHVSAGYIYVTATATALNGAVFVEEYHQTASAADDIYAYLTVDNCHYENFSAMLLPATIIISESNPATLTLSGYPSFITLGDTVYTEGLTGKVTYEDGTSADVTVDDFSFIAPDLTTTGSKTVTVLYNKTSRGNYCTPIYATYNILITDFRSLKVDVAESAVYYFPTGVTELPVSSQSYTLYGVDSEGVETAIDGSLVSATVKADGTLTAEYQGMKAEGKVKVGATDAIQIGAADFSTGWWTVFSDEVQIKKGETFTQKLQLRSDNLENYHCPVVLLRTSEEAEYGVLRADNYGWGNGYSAATLESDWDWDTFQANLDGSVYEISVTNNGATIDVVMNITYQNGETHIQKFTGVSTTTTTQTDEDDVYVSFLTEEAYLILFE